MMARDSEEKMQLLAKNISEDPPVDGETGEELSAVLTKFVVVAEWIDTNGDRWLTRRYANGNGEHSATWDAKGMLHEALFGDTW